MTIMSATFHFFNIIQNSKQRTFTISIIGKAMPINEKKDVLSGDTYHAGNDRKRKKMDIMVITKTITFIIFCTIINGNSSIFYLHQIVDAFLRMSDCCILIARSEEHTSELQSRPHLVCRLLLEKKKKKKQNIQIRYI